MTLYSVIGVGDRPRQDVVGNTVEVMHAFITANSEAEAVGLFVPEFVRRNPDTPLRQAKAYAVPQH